MNKKELKDKKKTMKEKQAEGKPMFELKITVDSNEKVEVVGPISDPLLIMRLLATAMNVVVDYNHSPEKLNGDIEQGRKEKEVNRIITGSGDKEPGKIIKLN